jgi:hypothetical protein
MVNYKANKELTDIYVGKQTKQPIARMYITDNGGSELRTLSGCSRAEVVNKIVSDCPEFCLKYGITNDTVVYRVFGARIKG